MLIDWHQAGLELTEPAMDANHAGMVALINRLAEADEGSLPLLYQGLVHHTESHFADEERWMLETRYPLLGEHRDEHHRLLAELSLFQRRLDRGQYALVRAFVRERLPDWLRHHVTHIDASLAAHLIAYRRGFGT